MSAYIKRSTYKDESILIECSICSAGISPKKTQEIHDTFRFCWHCGVKFGPEPKQGPTDGEWKYNPYTNSVVSHKPNGGIEFLASTPVGVEAPERHVNGHLMAASKKLLAVAKRVVEYGIYPPNPPLLNDIKVAVAEAEKGKQ